MLAQLARHEAPDLARADDDRALRVGGGQPAQRSCTRTRRCDEEHRGDREDEQLGHIGVRQIRHPGTEEDEPRADGDELADTDEVVDGGVVGPRSVAVVQVPGVRNEDPDRDHQREDQVLLADGKVISASVAAEELLGDHERENETEKIGGEQCPAQKPAPAAGLGQPRFSRRELGRKRGVLRCPAHGRSVTSEACSVRGLYS